LNEQNGHRAHHEHGGRQALAADIGYDEAHASGIDAQYVVEVATHVARCRHAPDAVQALLSRKDRVPGQHALLDGARVLQFALGLFGLHELARALDRQPVAAAHALESGRHQVAREARDEQQPVQQRVGVDHQQPASFGRHDVGGHWLGVDD